MNENKIIRQISDYSLDELNEHISIVYQIPDYIMDFVRRQYWIDQIKMFKNIILDNIEQKTCIFDRHVKVQKWIDKINKSQFSKIKYDDKYIYLSIGEQTAKTMSYHDFYFEYREEIESYFLNMIENPSTITISNNDENDEINLDVDMQKLLEE